MAFLPKKFMMILLFVAVALYFIGSGSPDDAQKNFAENSQKPLKASFFKKDMRLRLRRITAR
jgi:hypothetical protein